MDGRKELALVLFFGFYGNSNCTMLTLNCDEWEGIPAVTRTPLARSLARETLLPSIIEPCLSAGSDSRQ